MAVAADEKETFLVDPAVFEKRKKVISFVAESAVVGVVVFFAQIIGANHRSGGDEEFVFGVTLAERFFDPGFLPGTPDGFVGAVRHGVGAAMDAAFGQPDLQIAGYTMSAIGDGIGVVHFGVGQLFEHDAFAKCG